MIGPVNENDPVEKLWKCSGPVQQTDGFGVQVNSEALPTCFLHRRVVKNYVER